MSIREAREYVESREAAIRADEREKAAQRVSETFWPTDGSWVTEETTFDAVGRSAIAAVRGES